MAMPRATMSGAGRRADRLAVEQHRVRLRCASTPEIERISVVLPAPLAPMMAMVSPCVERDVDAEQRLEIAVARGEASGFEQRHQTSIPR